MTHRPPDSPPKPGSNLDMGPGSGSVGGRRGDNPRVPPPLGATGTTVWTTALTVARTNLRLTAMQNSIYFLQSPYYCHASDKPVFTATYEGATTVSSPSVIAYKNRTVVTSNIFQTNSPTASGNEVVLSAAQAWTSGERYVIELTATVDGSILTKKLVVIVAVTGGE
jgi:hypothetical protein